jgi:hypothetical protein
MPGGYAYSPLGTLHGLLTKFRFTPETGCRSPATDQFEQKQAS